MDQRAGGYVRGGSKQSLLGLSEALCEAVALTVELQTKLEDGKTKLDHLTQVEESTGRSHIPDIDIPPHGEHVWNWFWALSNTRGSSGFGASSLSYLEISAWATLTQTEVRPFEVEIIMTMDAAYMKASSELPKSSGKERSRTRK